MSRQTDLEALTDVLVLVSHTLKRPDLDQAMLPVCASIAGRVAMELETACHVFTETDAARGGFTQALRS